MKDIIIYGNGPAGNHGCEALTYSINLLLSDDCAKPTFATLNLEEDCKYCLDECVKFCLLENPINNHWFKYLFYLLSQKVKPSDYRYFMHKYHDFLKTVNPSHLYLSAGGDNYSYNFNEWLYCLNYEINKKGGKTALIGCSILEHISDKQMVEDLSLYNTIITRESMSHKALVEAGVNSKIYCLPDPAFALPFNECELPNGFISNNTVGINVSPMIIERENISGMTMANYKYLIQQILSETSMNIALIPHVVWPTTDDRMPLSELYDSFKTTGRVVFIEDHNAMELKYIISRCRFMIAARTHASIAAYSTCVPTLVVGYSVKAKGIALDLFGDIDHYVVSVQGLLEENNLYSKFQWIYEHEEAIRLHYELTMPSYKERLKQYRKIIYNI